MNMSLEKIVNSEEDIEIKRYQILLKIQEYAALIRKNKLYPTLTELVHSAVKLETSCKKVSDNGSRNNLGEIFNEDYSIMEVEPKEEADETTELIGWSMYHINKLLDEGIALFEFAEDAVKIEQINGQGSSTETGYLIIPDLISSKANIYRFETITFGSDNVPVTSVKTKLLISYSEEELLENSNPAIKVLLDYIDDKNAPIFFCSYDIELPFNETILPVAKKNLLKLLSI